MKRAFLITGCFLAVGTVAAQPDAGEIVISPASGRIAEGDAITITFPQPMVPAEMIDIGNQPAPFVSQPKLDGKFLWKSQIEGVFTVSGVVAGATHRLTLASGLKDATGKSFVMKGWSAELAAPPFKVKSDFEQTERLPARPQVYLDSSYAVRLTEAVEHIYFQDRDSRARFPVEVVLASSRKLEDALDARDFTVKPREPLPVGRTYDLIVNGLVEAKSRQPLPYLFVLPVGKTEALKVEWVGAFNHPLEKPSIRIKFDDEIDPVEASPQRIVVDPLVKEMKLLAEDDEIEITGDFDLKQRYKVTISPALKGERGYSLAGESRWGATFRAKEPCLIFPSSQVFARARQELRFAFYEVNTPQVLWKLARIPEEKLAAISARLTEFNKDMLDPVTGKVVIDPRTGFAKPFQTELLVEAFQLPVVASGTVDATSDDAETRREIRCRPTGTETYAGAYLFEASATFSDGRVVGNRSIICVNDYLLTQKRSPTQVIMRVAKMSDGQPLSGVTVRAVTRENIELARAITDTNGLARFSRATLFPEEGKHVHLYIADASTGPALQFANKDPYPGAYEYTPRQPEEKNELTVEIITDRNLYRPSQTVKMKGIVREKRGADLAIPATKVVRWHISQSYRDRAVADGTATLSSYGAWEADWNIPQTVQTGPYEIRCEIGKEEAEGHSQISVEEYRVPLFTVEVETETETAQTAHAKVSSAYFHGAPNVGARVHWTANWSVYTEYPDYDDAAGNSKRRYNSSPELGPHLDIYDLPRKKIEGDATLDEHGFVTLACESPFKDNPAIGRAAVYWSVEVTSVDGQTIPGGDSASVFSAPVRLGVHSREKPGEEGGIIVSIDALEKDKTDVKDVPVRVDLFHITTKTVKEQIAPFVYRYRNTDQFSKIASQELKTPAEYLFRVTKTGRYALAASATDRKTPLVSDTTLFTGEEPAQMPVESETSFKIELERKTFLPGENATLSIQAPFAGVAWVSIETDEILDTLLVPLSGNAGRIELPIKSEYAPNATVSIYLVKPGGDNELPRERFAFTEIEVRRPERELKVGLHLGSTTAKPGDIVRGEVRVTSETKPVADVDLAVFAVDDAVLTLGEWKLPEIEKTLYPRRPYSIRTFQALRGYIDNLAKLSLIQKGFIIGGGVAGYEAGAERIATRKEFKTLAFWQGSLKTGTDGTAKFEFTAPDNLTMYRVVAIGQTMQHQFGGDASQTVEISKALLIDPALPRFLRDGDEVELRAVVRQNFTGDDQVVMRCVTDASCKLLTVDSATQSAHRDAPSVFRFKAKVTDVDLKPAKIRFEAVSRSNREMADAVEITLPVHPPTIARTESVAGGFTGPQFNAQSKIPGDWKRTRGKLDVIVSTSPWLPKIAGLPVILEYPHGCFEQISTKLLGYSLLANLLAYLPDLQQREAEYRTTLQRGIKQFADSLGENGTLPYWPGGKEGNAFVTCQALWAVNEAANAGFEPPPELQEKLAGALKKIVKGRIPASHFEKCFALFVLTQSKGNDDFSGESQELYLHRNEGSDEDRALLAMALHRQNTMVREQQQLLREIDAPIKERAFNPATFTSMTRAEAMCAFAFDTIAPQIWTKEKKQRVRDRLLTLMDSSAALSTQENLWLLLAFKSVLGATTPPALQPGQPVGVASKNGRSAAWLDRKIDSDLLIKGLNQGALTFLMQAEYSANEVETDRVDRGFRVERVVKNLTEPKRTGTANAPFKIGDQMLVTYRVNTRKLQNFVALEDALPAGFEIVNPNLALIGKFFQLPPPDPQDRPLWLSYSERRDRVTLLYFDTIEPGTGTYSVLARATAAGVFRWPATQVAPMYDSRFSGLSPSSLCVISAD